VVLGCVAGLSGCSGSGFASASLNARGDIRLSDHDLLGNSGTNAGLFAPGSLDLRAAQVYVTSRFQTGQELERDPDDPGFLVQAGQRISVSGNGNPAPVPLSFGERLTLRAPVIEQGGILRAPQGQIRLEGRDAEGNPTGSVT